jgi:23S rRNA pseudouridine2604 synthase
MLKGGYMDERINKFLSSSGFCSRREADRLVGGNRVTIDGKVAELGSRVNEHQQVCVDGKPVKTKDERILIAFNKPVGVVCTTTDKQGGTNIVDYIGYDKRIYPVGRLDKDSEGLILLTNQGQLMDDILRSVNGHEKEYIVRVSRDLEPDFEKEMSKPMYIEELDRWTKKCKVKIIDSRTFKIVLTQGLNRQIRRMCQQLGYKVVELKRIRIMNINLGSLKTGQYRNVTDSEYSELVRMTGRKGDLK